MDRPMIVALSLGIVALGGCRKALTESSASGVIQKWVDSQAGGTVSTFAGALTGQIGRELPQRWMAAGVQRLLKEGYLQEKTAIVTYPNFSGQFSGTHVEEVDIGAVVRDMLILQSSGQPPQISGTYQQCKQSGPCSTVSVNGVVQKQGQTQLAVDPNREEPLAPRFPRLLHLSLARGNPDALLGTFEIGYPTIANLNQSASVPFRVTGRAGPDIQQNLYVYTWTDKLPKDAFNGAMLKLGRLVLQSCDHLLLGSETTATASCKTQVKLTNAAEVIFGSRPTEQPLLASFGKQPDGTWIGTGVNYSAPPYNIFQ
jgi:hypothetical protein